MKIKWIKLKGFRNFNGSHINFNDKTLLIGANDVGKTNLLYAIRLLLDRTLSETNIEPLETDFHVRLDGTQSTKINITIKLSGITEDAVRSKLKGNVSDDDEAYIHYEATREHLDYKLFIGFSEESFEEIDARFYLKHIHFRYIQSSRDLNQYIRSEKRHLLKLAKESRAEGSVTSDLSTEKEIQEALATVNTDISELSYVSDATGVLNEELKKLSHHNDNYSVNLEAKSVNFSTFIDQLSLGASTSERSVGLGGDGRNNQILMALWKAKSQREHDLDSEAVIYCVEEPEAHLHPHQQRKLAKYLVEELPGQVFVSSHSPQITAGFSPDSIVRIYENEGKSVAASDGCSDCIDTAWQGMGYRMSILPAESFFADAVFLVEGPSEILFYNELASQLGIDLDFHNISILSVDGIAFNVFVKILDAMNIPWVMRTDNDVFKVKKSNPTKWNLAGLNRALRLAEEEEYEYWEQEEKPDDLSEQWDDESPILNPKGIYVAKTDLENDLGAACSDELKKYSGKKNITAAIKYLQGKKAIRMREFLSQNLECLRGLTDDDLAKPLHHIVGLASDRTSSGEE